MLPLPRPFRLLYDNNLPQRGIWSTKRTVKLFTQVPRFSTDAYISYGVYIMAFYYYY